MAASPVIILGSGLAGWTVAREFRKLDATTPLLMVTANNGDFYAKPSLSNAYAQKRNPAQLVSTAAAKMAQTLNVELLPMTQVRAIDTATQCIHTDQSQYSYSALVLALGAQPIRLTLAGDASAQVQAINSLEDFSHFYQQLAHRPLTEQSVVLIGAGLIGCEFANDLATAGAQVHVMDPSARPLAALLPEAASLELQHALQQQGVQWHFGASVNGVNSANSSNQANQPNQPHQHQSTALQVVLANGQTQAADAVLSAVGLRANIGLASAAGIACERGILVNAQLQTRTPGVYALGDCAQYDVAQQRTLPYVMPIMHAARTLAAHLAGQVAELVFPVMPISIKTPAYPIVMVAPSPACTGEWQHIEPQLWHFYNAKNTLQGFILGGSATTRRAEQLKLLEAGIGAK